MCLRKACAPLYHWRTVKLSGEQDPVGTCFVAVQNFSAYAEYSPCRTSESLPPCRPALPLTFICFPPWTPRVEVSQFQAGCSPVLMESAVARFYKFFFNAISAKHFGISRCLESHAESCNPGQRKPESILQGAEVCLFQLTEGSSERIIRLLYAISSTLPFSSPYCRHFFKWD